MRNLILMAVLVLAGLQSAFASYGDFVLQRDTIYEQNLRFQASPDQTLTPARVLRWLAAFMAHTSFIPSTSSTEFEPIVNVDNTHIRIVAAVAYRF